VTGGHTPEEDLIEETTPRTRTVDGIEYAIWKLRAILRDRPTADAKLRAEVEHVEEQLTEALACLEKVPYAEPRFFAIRKKKVPANV
jgi:hypothetical protein